MAGELGGMLADGQTESRSGTTWYAGGEAALTQLLQQLLGGGTQEQRDEQIRRLTEIQNVQGQRAGYTKQNAFADAVGAQNQQSRLALEKLLPSIIAAASGAGTSKGSMRALLTQDAANKAAESAAALGLKASVDYGNISNGMNQVLEALTRQGNPITDALLKAIELSKGNNANQISGGSVTGGRGSSYGGVSYGGTMSPTKWGDDLLDGTFNPSTPQYGNMNSSGPGSNLVGEDPYAMLNGQVLTDKYGDPVSGNSGYGSLGSQNVWDDYTF